MHSEIRDGVQIGRGIMQYSVYYDVLNPTRIYHCRHTAILANRAIILIVVFYVKVLRQQFCYLYCLE
jgi:hypothetical protein